jgi:hypothetical protein
LSSELKIVKMVEKENGLYVLGNFDHG